MIVPEMKQKTVALLFGGESSEHEVSISSAKNVYDAIDKKIYSILPIYIDRAGVWRAVDGPDATQDTAPEAEISLIAGKGIFRKSSQDKLPVDVILPILHGKNGEDGAVQGLAQLLHIPIVGCDMTASALAMDKIATKEVLLAHQIRVVPYLVHVAQQTALAPDEVLRTLGNPLFVKPSRAGSSVGVSKVSNAQELESAINEAHLHDDRVLIEKAITCRELEVGVLGTFPSEQLSTVGEVIPGEEFYSYEDKYSSESRSHTTIPADIDDTISREIQDTARKVYNALHCSGLSRIDFFLAEDNTIYFNEINTIPGFTNISMYPKLWEQNGVGYSELINLLIQDALERSKI